MPGAEFNTTPREIRNFATLQLGLTGAFLVALYWICGGSDADYPPPWLAALLVVPIIAAAFLAERVWLTASPLSSDLKGFDLTSEALSIYASQTVRKLVYVEAAMLPAVIVAFVGSYAAWPIVIAGFPGILLLAWETWPTARNTSRTAAMLDSGGAKSGLVEGFPRAVSADVSARLAWPDDAAAMAHVQVAAWRTNYAELIPAEELEALDPAQLAERWAMTISSPKEARMRALVALERADVRGFTLVHPSYDPDSDQVADGEIGEFIIDPQHQREGHGSRLLQAAIDTLTSDRFTRAVWWIGSTDDVLRRFVSESGWEPDGAHRELAAHDGSILKQIRLHTSLA